MWGPPPFNPPPQLMSKVTCDSSKDLLCATQLLSHSSECSRDGDHYDPISHLRKPQPKEETFIRAMLVVFNDARL
jgi:hypothetical protein